MSLRIPANDFGKVHLFTVAPDLAQRLAESHDLDQVMATALGTTAIDAAHADLIAPAQLGGLGLSGYLTEGMGIPADQIPPELLAQITGPVLLVRSAAFLGEARDLAPQPGVQFVTSFAEARDDLTQRPLQSEAAKGTLSAGPGPRKSDAAMMGKVAMAALAVLLALVVVMILIGG